MSEYVIGLDYGSDSARALVVDVVTGKCLASSVKEYPRWKKGLYCNPKVNMWRQHPKDYLEVLEYIVIDALSKCEAEVAPNVVGMAFDTTGSTPALVAENGQPLAMLPEYSENPNAMFVLWKDHTAMEEAREINEACRNSAVDYAKYEGGTYSPEWLWAKALHCVRSSPELMRDAYSVVECCEWLPAVLTGVQHSGAIVRSRCAYGHKLMWNEEWGGLPPENFSADSTQGFLIFAGICRMKLQRQTNPSGHYVWSGLNGSDFPPMLSSREVRSIVMWGLSVPVSRNKL